jgi:hypothetical protein
MEYQSWEKYCDGRAHQNSAFLHESTEGYDEFGECQPAARMVRHFFAIQFFGHTNLEVHYGIEYQL